MLLLQAGVSAVDDDEVEQPGPRQSPVTSQLLPEVSLAEAPSAPVDPAAGGPSGSHSMLTEMSNDAQAAYADAEGVDQHPPGAGHAQPATSVLATVLSEDEPMSDAETNVSTFRQRGSYRRGSASQAVSAAEQVCEL